jgi:hypothetical protein
LCRLAGFPLVGAGLCFEMGPETKALGFFECNDFPALWTCGQDDELVIDNQAFWSRRSCEELPEYRATALLPPDERLRRRARRKLRGNAASQ